MEIKTNFLRGKILRLLKDIYPDGMNQLDIVGIYYQYHKPTDIVRSLEYLSDKEYVVRKEMPHPYKAGESIVWYKLLPKGIDLVEGNIPADPGVTVVTEA